MRQIPHRRMIRLLAAWGFVVAYLVSPPLAVQLLAQQGLFPFFGSSTAVGGQVWAYVETTANRPSGSATTVNHSITTDTTGNTLIAWVSWGSATGSVDTVTDDKSQTWAQCGAAGVIQGNGYSLVAYVAGNAASGATSVTADFDGASSYTLRSLVLQEYSGLATSPCDLSKGRSMTNPGTGTNAVTTDPSGTIAQANSLAVACTVVNNGTVDVTTGTNVAWTGRYDAAGHTSEVIHCEDYNIPSVTTVEATWTINVGTNDPNSIVVVLKQ